MNLSLRTFLEPVSILEAGKLLCLDAVESVPSQAIRDRSLRESSREQVNLVRRRIERLEHLPLFAWNLGGSPGHARYGGKATEPSPGVVARKTVVASSLDVPRHQIAAKVVSDLAEQEVGGVLRDEPVHLLRRLVDQPLEDLLHALTSAYQVVLHVEVVVAELELRLKRGGSCRHH